MPLYRFKCEAGHITKRIMKVEDFKLGGGVEPCSKMECFLQGKHEPEAASSQTMEVLDNGIVARKVERYSEAERIFKEREIAHDQKYKKPEDPEE